MFQFSKFLFIFNACGFLWTGNVKVMESPQIVGMWVVIEINSQSAVLFIVAEANLLFCRFKIL